MTASRAAPGPWTVVVCLALLCAIWGSTYLVIRESLHDLPPFLSAGVRFVCAGAILTAIAPRIARREGGARPTLGLTLTMGLLNVTTAYGIVYWSETILPSGLVSVLWSVYPLLMALSGHAFLAGERLRALQWLGFLFGFAGVGLLFATDLRAIGPAAIPAGLVLLLSPLATAIGTTIIKRHGAGTSSVLLNRNGMLIGAFLLSALALLFERDVEVRWTPRAVLSVGYLAVMGTVVTFGLFYWLMRYASATKLSLIAYVIPVIALALGTLLADEPFGLQTLLGSLTVLAGVALVTARRSRVRT